LNFKSGARSLGFGTLRLITQYSKSIDLSEMLHDSVCLARVNPKETADLFRVKWG
jgi:hypothetical protein